MSNEILKYDNELNSVPFRRFNNRELNILFGIISRLRDKGTLHVEFGFDEIRTLADYKQHGKKFVEDLENVYEKMISLKIWRKNAHVSEAWILFTHYKIDKDNKIVSVGVNPDMVGILNHLANWTRFSLQQFVELKSTYSKTAFRLLKQYRTSGKRYFSSDEFRLLFDVAKSYRSSDIDKRVLKPIKEELTPYFRGLKISKDKSGSGSKIGGYLFTWKQEPKNKDDFYQGLIKDVKNKLYNIEFNGSLTPKEKENAKQNVLEKYKNNSDFKHYSEFFNSIINSKESLYKDDSKTNSNRKKDKDVKRKTKTLSEYLNDN